MAGESGTGGLGEARAGVERFCLVLSTPSPAVLEGAAVLIEAAIAEVAAWRKRRAAWLEEAARAAQAGPMEQDLMELRRIRRAAGRARKLLEKAAAYHAGWSAYLGTRAAGYQPSGEAAALPRPRRVLAEG